MKIRVIPQAGTVLLLVDDVQTLTLSFQDAITLQAELALATRDAVEVVLAARVALDRGIDKTLSRFDRDATMRFPSGGGSSMGEQRPRTSKVGRSSRPRRAKKTR